MADIDTGTPTVDEGHSSSWSTQPAPGSPEFLRANAVDLSDADSAALLTAAEVAAIDKQIQGEGTEPPAEDGEELQTALAIPASLQDDALVRDFAVFATGAGLDQETVDEVLGFYEQSQVKLGMQLRERDDRDTAEGWDALRLLYGSNYKATVNRMRSTLETAMPPGTFQAIANARFPDGRAIGNDAQTIAFFVNLAEAAARRHTPPAGAGASDQGAVGIEAEIARIERKVGTREYWRNSEMQARLRELYDLRGR